MGVQFRRRILLEGIEEEQMQRMEEKARSIAWERPENAEEVSKDFERFYNGFKKSIQFDEREAVPDKIGLIILREIRKRDTGIASGKDIQCKANGVKNKR